METPLLTMTALFDRSVAQHGDELAVKDDGFAYSYDALNARAAGLASQMRDQGLERGDAVVVYADRTAHAVAAVLAVMKAGGAFVPVGLDTPPARLDFILRDAKPKLLLADRRGRERLTLRGPRLGTLAVDGVPGPRDIGGRGVQEVGPDDLSYIIYTSGTTGQPKGVMIQHGSIARRFHDWDRAFALTGASVGCLQLAKFGFDVFIGDLAKALCSGGRLVLCSGEVMLDPARLYRTIVDEQIDYIDTVPAVLRALTGYLEETAQDLRRVRIINCGADVWTKDDYRRSQRITRVARLFNGYGVTECTVESTLFEDDGAVLAAKTTLPIGCALGSDEILIVDEALRPVAPGVAGQICIGGPCVARGYLNRPELNERAFFVRPGRSGEAVRFYQTGDRGRVDENAVFEFLGRLDAQIKINGHRIEPQEIESVLERMPGVEQAAVCLDAERQTLIAFVKTLGGTSIEPSEAASHAGRHLPSYMVPGRIVVVDAFPQTQNGKVDRLRLASEWVSGRLGRRRSLDLNESRSVTELCERLWRRNIDLLALVNEFVKPSAEFGLLVSGVVIGGDGIPHSVVKLLIVVADRTAMKRRRREVAGTTVEYLAATPPVEGRISLIIGDLEFQLDFVVDPHAFTELCSAEVELPRQTASWVVHGHNIVERCARRYPMLLA